MIGNSLTSIVVTLLLATSSQAQQSAPIDIGSRLELFVDDALVDRMNGGATLHLHKPAGKEVVLEMDRPWEDTSMDYYTVFLDGDKFRMYYRGRHHGSGPDARGEPMCYAESKDGIHWVKPNLGLFEFEGSPDNNIVVGGDDEIYPATEKWRGDLGFDTDLGWRGDMVPFKDANPNAAPDAQYKALLRGCRGPHQVLEGQSDYGMYVVKSPDGLNWSLMRDKPVITKGRFDSQNLAFWDPHLGRYVAFVRDMKWGTADHPLANAPTKDQFQGWLSGAAGKEKDLEEVFQGEFGGVRDVRIAYSDDFVNWTEPVPLRYPGDSDREMYTNAVIAYERAPHILLGFPTEFTDICSAEQVHPIFMTSRDGGKTFLRHGEPLISCESPRDRDGNRSNYMAHGMVRGNEREYFVYATEGYGYEESDAAPDWKKVSSEPAARLRRFVYRVDGFMSVRAGLEGGEVVTKPLTFRGDQLAVNYIKYPVHRGDVRVEIQNAVGEPLEGFSLPECVPMRGDEIARPVKWTSGRTLDELVDQPVRVRFTLRNADLFSFQFVDAQDDTEDAL